MDSQGRAAHPLLHTRVENSREGTDAPVRPVGVGLGQWTAIAGLGLWFAAESIHPAGDWIAAPDVIGLALALAATLVLGACLSGVGGLAFTALAGGVLALVQPDAATASRALALVAMLTVYYAVWTNRGSLARCPPSWMLTAGALIIPVALWLAVHVSQAVLAAAVGALLIAQVLYAFVRSGGRGATRADGARVDARRALDPQGLLLAIAGFSLLARMF